VPKYLIAIIVIMKVAVVTGSNKGLGFGIVRALCKKFDGDVFLTSRSEARGKEAIAALEKEGLQPKLHLLDINCEESIIKLRDFLKTTYGGIDILVNNAAIAFPDDLGQIWIEGMSRDKATFGEQAKATMETNYWATKKVCETLFPLLRDGARVVNVSSSAGFLGNLGLQTDDMMVDVSAHTGNEGEKWTMVGIHTNDKVKGEEIKKTLASEDLSMETLDKLMKNFEETAKAGTHNEHGWPNVAYFVSKIGVSALSRVQQKMMDKDPRDDIVVNFVHPGYVDTDMVGNQGALTIDRGAEGPVYCALLPAKTNIRGEYLWHDCQVIDWVNGPLPSFA